MEHTSTSKFVNVHEQIVRVQQHVLDIQSDVQQDETTFAQSNQAYQQVFQLINVSKDSILFLYSSRNSTMLPFADIYVRFHSMLVSKIELLISEFVNFQ